MTESSQALRVAVGGLGAIGLAVARRLDEGLPGQELVAVSARDREAAAQRLSDFRRPVPVVASSFTTAALACGASLA